MTTTTDTVSIGRVASAVRRLSEVLGDASDWLDNAAEGRFYFGRRALYTEAAALRQERNAFDLGRETGALHGRAPEPHPPAPVRHLHSAR